MTTYLIALKFYHDIRRQGKIKMIINIGVRAGILIIKYPIERKIYLTYFVNDSKTINTKRIWKKAH